MIAIPNMEKPEYCRVCHERLKCKQYDGEILHTPDDCPLIEIVECKDCKHYQREECRLDPFWEKDTEPTDFCSKGERRADETQP